MPIYLTLCSDITKKESIATLCNRHTDWSYFRHILNNNPYATLSNIKEIEDCTLKITSPSQCAAWNSTPELKKHTFNKSYPNDIKILIKAKLKLRRKWQRNRLPHLKTELNRTTKELSFFSFTLFSNKIIKKKICIGGYSLFCNIKIISI